jgi:RNA polymerase sigma-70 factor (ECF subfamily)
LGVVVESFEAWYERVRGPMYSALSAWCGSTDAAADALDEGFVRALERWGRVRAMASPEGWLWRTSTNHVRKVAKRRARELEVLRAANADLRDAQTLATTDVDLQRALLSLGARQRTAVVLHYLADMSTNDVAVAMGIAPGTVHATLHQARERLSALLAEPVVIPPENDDPASGAIPPPGPRPAARPSTRGEER